MAYNVPNWGSIAGGQTLRVAFMINGGQGAGSQWAQGAPQNGPNTLVTTNPRISLSNGKFEYAFDLTCFGIGTSYGLHGGGQT